MSKTKTVLSDVDSFIKRWSTIVTSWTDCGGCASERSRRITESQKETLHNLLRRLYIIVAVNLLQTRTNKNRLVTDL